MPFTFPQKSDRPTQSKRHGFAHRDDSHRGGGHAHHGYDRATTTQHKPPHEVNAQHQVPYPVPRISLDPRS